MTFNQLFKSINKYMTDKHDSPFTVHAYSCFNETSNESNSSYFIGLLDVADFDTRCGVDCGKLLSFD